jgi:RND family efflux transporter MFP subunit
MTLSPEAKRVEAQPIADSSRAPLERAWTRFGLATQVDEFCQSWLEIQCNIIDGVESAVVVLQKPGTQNYAPVAFFPTGGGDRSHLANITERALREGRGIAEPMADAPETLLLGYPVRADGQVRSVVSIQMSARDDEQLQVAMRQLQWGAGWIEVLLRRHTDPAAAGRLRMKIVLQLVSTFLDRAEFKEAATALVTELASQLGCDRVVLGLFHGKTLRVEAVSHTVQFDRQANLLNATIAAMHEAIDQHETVVFPPDREDRFSVTFAHSDLAQATAAGGIITLPLVHRDRELGALVLERAPGFRFDTAAVELLDGVAALLSPLIDLQLSRRVTLTGHAKQSVATSWDKLVGPRHGGFKFAAAAVAVITLFLVFTTGTYRVSTEARIEGEIQRALPAPFQGYVRETGKRAGDTVEAGEVLARLDDRDLKLERVRLVASREQFVKQQREALAKRERAQASIVSAQVEQVEAQLALVEEQLSRTEVTAPFKGVIVSGDLSQSLGAPLERGQVLFEVAPLDAYRVVLQVDERDIAYLKQGQRGDLVLASLPGSSIPVAVSKITPVSTPKEGRNLFRVEAQLDRAPGSRLRPGMEGVAKIGIDERSLVWIWTRQLANWVRLKTWAWTP